MPLEISKIALQLDSAKTLQNNMFKAMAAVYKERGWQGFTVGYLGRCSPRRVSFMTSG